MTTHRRTIVVIEDDPSLNLAVGRLLEAAGFETCTYSSAEAALADDRLAAADCLVLDVQLPGMSGFELQRRLMRDGRCTPVIFITANDDAAHQRMAHECGAAGYLPKPFSSASLIDAVQRAMSSPEAR